MEIKSINPLVVVYQGSGDYFNVKRILDNAQCRLHDEHYQLMENVRATCKRREEIISEIMFDYHVNLAAYSTLKWWEKLLTAKPSYDKSYHKWNPYHNTGYYRDKLDRLQEYDHWIRAYEQAPDLFYCIDEGGFIPDMAKWHC